MSVPDGTLRRPIWRFAHCEYDELDDQLWVGERKAELFPRSRAVLLALLKSAGHRMSRGELLHAVWHAGEEMDGALSNAIYDLRSAISPEERDRVIRTLRGAGFQIVVPVERRIVEEHASESLRLAPGDAVPGQREWKLIQPLDQRKPHRVWLGERPSTGGHIHVLKFAESSPRLDSLRREIEAAERLARLDLKREYFAAAYGWRTTTRPYYLETEFGGTNLLDWAENQRTGPGLSPDVCTQVMADLAEAVEIAHRSNIIHNNIRPEHVLVRAPSESGERWQIKLVGFGCALFLDELNGSARTESQGENSGEHQSGAVLPPEARTPDVYIAPETRAGSAPSRSSDVYALGLLLFQILCGDFYRGLTSDWESLIADPALREDIREATSSTSAQRIVRAGDLAARLRSAQARNEHTQALQRERERADLLERQLALRNARRPWAIALVVALVAGVSISLVLYIQAARQRNIAEAVNAFLAEDVLTRASPYKTGVNTESLVAAIKRVSPQIDRRFSSEPLVAAQLHATIARALDNRMDYPAAEPEFAEAAALYRRAEGPLSQKAVITEMQRIAMHTRDTAPGHLQRAQQLFDAQRTTLSKLEPWTGELPIWVDYAQGLLEMFGSDAGAAVKTFEQGIQSAAALPHFNQAITLTMEQLLAVSETRSGQCARAETLIRHMMVTVQQIRYTGKPNYTNLGVNLAQVYMAEQKNREAIDEINQVYPSLVEQMGSSSLLTLTAIGVRAQAEASLMLWDDAARDSLSVFELSDHKSTYFDAGALSDASLSECRGGHFAEGLAHVDQAIELWRSEPNNNVGAESSFQFSRATCLVGLGRVNEAGQALNNVNVPALAQIYADADMPADVELAHAEIDLAKHDELAARTHLDRAQGACLKPNASPYRAAWFAREQTRLNTHERSDLSTSRSRTK